MGLSILRAAAAAAHGEVAVVLTEKGAALRKAVQEFLTSETMNNHPANSVQQASILEAAA
jgi:hypothetical protein